MAIARQTAIDLLSKNICMVTFNKVNGEVRALACTLRPDLVPPTKGGAAPDPNVLPVWSLENRAWRSFRLNNVLRVDILQQ